MEWLVAIGALVSGAVIGIIFMQARNLIFYIQTMDKEELVCDTCEHREACIGIKPIGSSNWMTEFTYTTFLLVKRRCGYTVSKTSAGKHIWIWMVINSILYEILYLRYGMGIELVLYCLTTTALLYLAVVDWKTQYIPAEFNILIFIFGLINTCVDSEHWIQHVIGLFAVSVFLVLVDFVGAKLRQCDHVIGGGDIKLMAAAGLLIGWKLNIVAFMMGCICGSIIHLIIMKIGRGEHKLAFGPYLAMGIYIAMICGEQLVSWYLGIMGL